MRRKGIRLCSGKSGKSLGFHSNMKRFYDRQLKLFFLKGAQSYLEILRNIQNGKFLEISWDLLWLYIELSTISRLQKATLPHLKMK